jgi:hypothetical protein
MAAGVIERDLHLIHLDISSFNTLGLSGIEQTKARQRVEKLFFDQTAHLQNARADCFEILLVLA